MFSNRLGYFIFILFALNSFLIAGASRNSDSNSVPNSSRKVAIIGAGIGGATASYFISKESAQFNQDQFEIDIFEAQNRIGGRIRSFSIDDTQESNVHEQNESFFELGADVWASPNLLLEEIAEELEIEISKSDSNAGANEFSVLVYTGKDYYPLELGDISNMETLITAAHMERFKTNLLQNYLEFMPRDYGIKKTVLPHPYSPVTVDPSARTPEHRIKTWDSIEDWSTHGNIDRFTSISTYSYLKRHGVSVKYIKRNIEPLTRVIYDQGVEANAFAGLVALVSSDQTRSAKRGLQSMVSKILNSTNANVHLSTPVKSIKSTPNGQLQVEYTNSNNEVLSSIYDNVIIACPIEFTQIDFTGIKGFQKPEPREYYGKSTTYVRSPSLNTNWLGIPSSTNAILTNEESDNNNVGFFSIIPHHRYSNGDYLFKVFSRQSLDEMENSLNNWFVNGTVIAKQAWKFTFPKLNPNKFQPIRLAPNVFYVSAIDSVAVAMEASTLSAKNIADHIVYQTLIQEQKEKSGPRGEFAWVLEYTQQTEYLFIAFILLGLFYTVSGLTWLSSQFNFLLLLAVVLVGHTTGYWLEWTSANLGLTDDVGSYAILLGADILGGILVAIGTVLGDAILPMAMLARCGTTVDIWGSMGVLFGLVLWPLTSDTLTALLSLISRFVGGSVPSLAILDVGTQNIIVSITLILLAIAAAVLNTTPGFTWKRILVVGFFLSMSHIFYLFVPPNFLGSTSVWTNVIPSHIASFLHQDGLAAIVDPFSSTQTQVLILVPCFLLGVLYGNILLALFNIPLIPQYKTSKKHQYVSSTAKPRFAGVLRFIGGVFLIIGMALHSGSYVFLTSYFLSFAILSVI